MPVSTFRSAAAASAAFLAALAGLGTFVAGSAACTTRGCINTTTTFVDGDMLDENTWESSPIDGTWLDYGPLLTTFIHIPQLANRPIADLEAFISPVPRPDDLPAGGEAPDNFTLASGNLAEFEQVRDFTPEGAPAYKNVTLYNATCAQYYVRVVVRAAPVAAATSPGLDAGDDDANSDGGT